MTVMFKNIVKNCVQSNYCHNGTLGLCESNCLVHTDCINLYNKMKKDPTAMWADYLKQKKEMLIKKLIEVYGEEALFEILL